MIKELVNIELKDLPIVGLDIRIIKKYIVKTSFNESFTVNNLSILLIKSGNFKFQLKEAIQDLTARDLIVIPKNSFCTLLEVQEKLQLFLISFSSEFAVENCLRKELVDSFYFFVRKESMKIALEEKDFSVLSLIYKLIYYINKDAKRNCFDFELQRISFNLFLHELRFIYSKYTSETLLNFSRKESLSIQFLTTLAIHCKRQHSVSFYAGALFVTPGYLNKIVKQVTAKPVKILIVEAIIAEAKNLLEDSQFPIVIIAEELEFSNASSFSVFFKRYTSFTPSEYRSNTIERLKSR
ncbi:MAG TPA: helix-turn-helix transcriptional regulator [Flavobacterium sp.]|uniref:helix-turn-helix domain-containing protein n=1 Tax=Flavobacterium sp. TaxID=239 RepID=UPI002DBF9B1B|nr:helix-turn-helix transcriptional regulator [Flavobacterium sp.]HEU4791361.1 helix-turn-helix transcriptional regulator [Flavobacterium sp.]